MGGTNTRGKTRGLKLAKKKLPRGKMFVEAPSHVMLFVGKYSTEFTTEVGVSIRSHAPLVKDWSDVDKEVKKDMIEYLQESFEFHEDVHTMSALDKQMRRSFRSWKYRLTERIKKSTNEGNLAAIKLDHIIEEQWMTYVQHITLKEFEERLVELRNSSSLSENELFTLVLPSKFATFRGIGVIPKPTRSHASEEVAALRKQLDESRARERENNAAYLESLKKNWELECRLASMESRL